MTMGRGLRWARAGAAAAKDMAAKDVAARARRVIMRPP
jgi:hypothetical protein